MQIVIDMNDNEYWGIKEYPDNITSYPVTIHLYEAVRNGTPLPKGHGRLIDADKLVPDCQEDSVYYDDDEHNEFTAVGIAQIECAETIVEADKGDEECR